MIATRTRPGASLLLAAAAAVGVGLALAGCSSDDAKSSPASTTSQASQTTSPIPNESASESASGDSASPPADASQGSGPELTGYGATKAGWLSAHEQAAGYAHNAAFGPMVKVNGESIPKYAAVDLETPVVLYDINLPDGTSLAEAKQVALEEFPPGASFGVVDDDEARCLLVTVHSKAAQHELHAHGYGSWVPLLAFSTVTPDRDRLDPDNVTGITLIAGQEKKNLGRC